MLTLTSKNQTFRSQKNRNGDNFSPKNWKCWQEKPKIKIRPITTYSKQQRKVSHWNDSTLSITFDASYFISSVLYPLNIFNKNKSFFVCIMPHLHTYSVGVITKSSACNTKELFSFPSCIDIKSFFKANFFSSRVDKKRAEFDKKNTAVNSSRARERINDTLIHKNNDPYRPLVR